MHSSRWVEVLGVLMRLLSLGTLSLLSSSPSKCLGALLDRVPVYHEHLNRWKTHITSETFTLAYTRHPTQLLPSVWFLSGCLLCSETIPSICNSCAAWLSCRVSSGRVNSLCCQLSHSLLVLFHNQLMMGRLLRNTKHVPFSKTKHMLLNSVFVDFFYTHVHRLVCVPVISNWCPSPALRLLHFSHTHLLVCLVKAYKEDFFFFFKLYFIHFW